MRDLARKLLDYPGSSCASGHKLQRYGRELSAEAAALHNLADDLDRIAWGAQLPELTGAVERLREQIDS